MSKKSKKASVELSKKIGLPPEQAKSLQGKKVMLPLAAVSSSSNRFEHSRDVKEIAVQIFKHLKKKHPRDSFVKMLERSKIETMCWWHDVGHCPYGHAGEDALNALISEDKDHYQDSFYSGYKHNLLSAKLLLDQKVNASWDIIDGIVKHSKTYPNNFNVSRVSHDNLLKLNYIFNCDKTREIEDENGKKKFANKSWYLFVKDFVSAFPCNLCTLKRYPFLSDEGPTDIRICDPKEGKKDCEFCIQSNSAARSKKTSAKDIKKHITQYLLFPHPLTLEGGILKLADEISCLVRDMETYFKRLLSEADKGKNQIIKARMANVWNLTYSELKAKAEADGKDIRTLPTMQFLELVKKLMTTATGADEMISFLIEQIDYTEQTLYPIDKRNFNNKPLLVRWKSEKKEYCLPLLDLEESVQKLFKSIKKSIYGIMHTDHEIKEDNESGEKCIKAVFQYYYDDPSAFFKIMPSLLNELDNITAAIHTMKGALIGKIEAAKQAKDTSTFTVDHMKLLNSLRREIAFYIAGMTEKEIEDLIQQEKIQIKRCCEVNPKCRLLLYEKTRK